MHNRNPDQKPKRWTSFTLFSNLSRNSDILMYLLKNLIESPIHSCVSRWQIRGSDRLCFFQDFKGGHTRGHHETAPHHRTTEFENKNYIRTYANISTTRDPSNKSRKFDLKRLFSKLWTERWL